MEDAEVRNSRCGPPMSEAPTSVCRTSGVCENVQSRAFADQPQPMSRWLLELLIMKTMM